VKRLLLLLVLFVFGLASMSSLRAARADTPAKASATDKNEAVRLKKEGDALLDQGRPIDALALYQKAYELSSDPALLYNAGRALESIGDYAEALDKLEQFERDAPPALRARVPGLRDLLVDLKSRIATIIVTSNAEGARVLLRDKTAGSIQGELRIRTRAGSASVEVGAEGFMAFHKQVELPAGTITRIHAELLPRVQDALVLVRTKPSADISIDGKPIGRSPLELRLAPGPHTLVAQAQGYERERIPMTLSLGDRRELDLELREPASVLSTWWFWTGAAAVLGAGVVGIVALTTERSADSGSLGQVTGP
jgi:tetratricopeptide (TPR) repeat protein